MVGSGDGRKGRAAGPAADDPKHVSSRLGRTSSSVVVTLKDIAKVAGVSPQTVSYVLNDNGSVSEDVRARVRGIAKRMGYRPNRSAKAMRTGRSQVLGLVVSDMGNPFYAEFAHAVERAAAIARYAVLLVDANVQALESGEAAERIADLQNHPVDGVISSVQNAAISKLKLPIVIFGEAIGSRDAVAPDDVTGGKDLAEYLLTLGHRRFGLVTSPLPGGIPVRRASLLNRLAADAEAEVVWEYVTPPTERVAEDVKEFLKRRDVTAIVCSNDMVAISVQRALYELGISVPGEVSVVGYDDIAWAGIVTPRLTTMRLPVSDLANAAIQLVIDRLEAPRRRPRRVSLPVTLVVRESVATVLRR